MLIFFSGSTLRWEILENELKSIPNATMLKNLCPTRWSSRYFVCKSIKNGFNGIVAALQNISEDVSQRPATRHEALTLFKKIKNLEFTFKLILWTPILERLNMTSKSLQCINMDLSSVVQLYKLLELYVCELRNNFENLFNEAASICDMDLFPNESRRQKKKEQYFLMKEMRKIVCLQKKKR